MLYDKTDDLEKRQDEKNKEHKMTREEALNRLNDFGIGNEIQRKGWLKFFEETGLIKFEEPKEEIFKIFQLDNNDGAQWNTFHTANKSISLNKIIKQYGTIRLEEWPEGLVLWVGGEIVWKSWIACVPR